MHRNQHRVKENEETEDYVPNKELDKTSEKDLNEMEVVIYLIKFQNIVIKMFTEVRRMMHEQSENFNAETIRM